MILIDFSGIAIAPVVMGQAKYNDENLIRHIILNSIRYYRQKFKQQYGEVVIVADGGGNWRKDVYPEYKGKRKTAREESKIDWDEAFRIINMILEEIKQNMPYKVIHQWGCEADDSIATIVHWTQEFGNYEQVMIVSADRDFRQLQVFDNVHQFSTVTKKLIKEPDPKGYLQEHILTGCSSDGVPNVLSDDDAFINENKRQVPLTAKKKTAIINDLKDGELLYAANWYRNYQRNKQMIDLVDMSCPTPVREEIINTFVNQNPSMKKMKVMNYLVKKRCKLLLESAGEFIS